MFSARVILCAFAVCAAVVYAKPQFGHGNFVPIVSQYYDLNPDGSYSFGYVSGDGTSRDEQGALRNRGSANEAMAVQGQYTYSSPQGAEKVNYIADEFGYQPTGGNIHPAIIKAVAQEVAHARANPQAGNQFGPRF